MRLRRELRDPWVVAPVIAAVLVAVLASSAAAVARPDLVFFRIGDKFAVIGWGMENTDQELPPFLDPDDCPEGVECGRPGSMVTADLLGLILRVPVAKRQVPVVR